jgi:hypothetical protein
MKFHPAQNHNFRNAKAEKFEKAASANELVNKAKLL